MKRTRNAILVTLLISMAAHAEDKWFWTLTAATQAATIYDLHTTRSAMQRCQSCYELNPVMRPFVASTPAALSAGLGLSSASIYGAFKLKKKGFRYWWVPLAAPIAVHTAAGIRNTRIR
jgi:hypothetical protein